MKRELRSRLALTHLAIALVAIVAVGGVVAYAASHRFDGYLDQVRSERDGEIVRALQRTYQPPDGWDATAIYALSQVATFDDVAVAVFSTEGQVLFTVQGRADGGGASPAPEAAPRSRADLAVTSSAIVVDGRAVASAEIYAPRRARAAAEEAYRSALTRDLLIAGGIAGVLAVLMSLLVSRRVTAPLEELAEAAGDVAGGSLGVRVAPRGDGEVAALATALNAMADRLAREEERRRDVAGDLCQGLRTPLATIQSRVQELESGALPATPENLRVIGAAVERLGRLVDHLRSLDELESEDLGVEHDPVDLAEVAAGAADRLRPAFRAKGVELVAEMGPGIVFGDPDRLSQVVTHLLDNALAFTPAGGRVAVTVDGGEGAAKASGALAGPAGTAVRLTVTDDGPGVDPIDLPFVFDRFYRAQARRGAPGAGLGLAVCRALVESQGGSIEVGNAPGGGARFTVLLPLAGPRG